MVDTFMHPAATSDERKRSPLYRGAHRYFPAALELVARMSLRGNEKHNPGQEMHHARGKSTDHGDCIERHQIDIGTIDDENGFDHAVSVAWRALAQLQELAETKYGWPVAPGAKLAESVTTPRVKVGDRFKNLRHVKNLRHGHVLQVAEVYETGGRPGWGINGPHVWFTEGTWISIGTLLDSEHFDRVKE